MIKDFGHDAAVGVVPAGDGGAVAGVNSVLKDGLMRAEGGPLASGGIFERDEQAASRDVDGVGRNAGEERRNNVAGVHARWDCISEDSGLGGEFVEGGKFEAGKTTLVELLVGEFIE